MGAQALQLHSFGLQRYYDKIERYKRMWFGANLNFLWISFMINLSVLQHSTVDYVFKIKFCLEFHERCQFYSYSQNIF